MALRLPLCLFNRHAPSRHRVKWDGLNFVGSCRYCKRQIRKEARGGWRKDWMVHDDADTGPKVGARAAHLPQDRQVDAGMD
jgi:hypothetical protein